MLIGIGLSPSIHLAPGRKPLAVWLSGAVYADWNPNILESLSQDSAGSTPVGTDGDAVGRVVDQSGGGFHAGQTTADSRPSYQGGALRFDGSADNLLSTLNAGAAGNTLIVKFLAPESVPATMALLGLWSTGDTRFYLGIHTNGVAHARVGDTTNRDGSSDLRGETVVLALTSDGTTIKLFVYSGGDVAEQYSGALSGTIPTTVPARIGALNANGSAAGYFAGDLYRALFAQKALTLSEFSAICPTF